MLGRILILEPKQLGQRIRQIREERGISQEQLANLIDRDQRAISLYESGQRRIFAHDIPTIAEALDVPVAYLYGDDDSEDALDAALLREFHRLDSGARKKVVEIMRLFSDTILGNRR